MGSIGRPPWTAQQTARLRELAADPELSNAAIAAALNSEFPGMGLTRNAVIGKLNRMAVVRPESRRGPGAKSVHGHPRIKRRKTTWLDEILPKRQMAVAERVMEQDRNMLRDLAQAPAWRPVPLLALKSHHCRWPIGDPPNVLFCGAERAEPLSYCILHARIAYRAPPRRSAA